MTSNEMLARLKGKKGMHLQDAVDSLHNVVSRGVDEPDWEAYPAETQLFRQHCDWTPAGGWHEPRTS